MHQPDSHPVLSIIIVNYNTCQLLLDCLDSIYHHTADLPVECIVIDNVSGDGSVEAVRERFPQVRLIANTRNDYYSVANNQGIRLASGRYILVLNPDTQVRGDTLQQLVAQMDAQPHIGAATTMLYFPDGQLQRNGSRHVTFGYVLLNYTFIGKLLPGHLHKYNAWLWYSDWDRTTPRSIEVLPGSCIIASKAIWIAVGGFEARMPMYFSDDYFSLAVQKMGKLTMYLASDGIIHYEGASARQVKAWTMQMYLHDLLIYTWLVFGRLAQIILAVLLIPTRLVLRLRAR